MTNQPATTITSVDDVVDFCADDPTGCTSIHLDHDGAFTCGTRATVLDSLEAWATDPSRIVQAASTIDTCGRRWIIFVRQDTPPTENDASHHLDIAAALACEGVDLIDTVIAWGDQHISMHQLKHRSASYAQADWHNAA